VKASLDYVSFRMALEMSLAVSLEEVFPTNMPSSPRLQRSGCGLPCLEFVYVLLGHLVLDGP